MDYKRIINGSVKVTVKKWDNEVVLTSVSTGAILAIKQFSDHIQAVMVARSL